MGAKLSQPQQEVYLQVGESQKNCGLKLSKGFLKRFVKWLFFYFPQMSPANLKSATFWQFVGDKILELNQRGDPSGERFLYMVWALRDIHKANRKIKEKPRVLPSSSQVPPPPLAFLIPLLLR